MRFTIRDIIWLTIVVGLALGCWLDNQRKAAHLANYKSELSRLHYRIESLNNKVVQAEQERDRLMKYTKPRGMVLVPYRPGKDGE